MEFFKRIFQSVLPGAGNVHTPTGQGDKNENYHYDYDYDYYYHDDDPNNPQGTTNQSEKRYYYEGTCGIPHSDHPHNHHHDSPFLEFSPFSRNFEDMWKKMDETFDEMFKMFGTDSAPMFDPFVFSKPGEGRSDEGHAPSSSFSRLPTNGNVRDYMLRREGSTVPTYDEEDVNVRSHMLRRPHSSSPSSSQKEDSKQTDINWDSVLKKGGTVDDILDGQHKQPPHANLPGGDSSGYVPRFKSVYRYSSTTTTRKPDGTIETRKITRDENGNERETVEVKKN